jgi:hypothetical protein
VSQRLAVVAGLFLVMLIGLIVIPPADERQAPLTVYSAEPGGAKALRLWLEALNYPVTTIEGDRYTIGRDVRTVLLLAPTQQIGSAALDELERWTRQGGRLVIGTDSVAIGGRLQLPTVGSQTDEVLRRFGLALRPIVGVTSAIPAEPGRIDPAIQTVAVTPSFEIILGDRADDARPLLVGRDPKDDARRPILAASVHDEASARLALSLIGPAGRGQVAFDELHHGFGALDRRHIYALLLEQSWGRAALLAAGLVLIFLLLRGRRLGRPVPVFLDRGRSLGELVTSQASLFRAGGKRAFLAEHLAQQLRRDLTQELGLPSDASDDEIAARASAMGRDPAPALRLLHQTRRARSDRELLALTREGAAAQADLGRPNPQGAQ